MTEFASSLFTQGLKDFIGIHYFGAPKWVRRRVGLTFCKKSAKTRFICDGVIFLLAGWDSDQLNEVRFEFGRVTLILCLLKTKIYFVSVQSMIPVYMGHAGAGSSTHSLLHLGQNINSGLFRPFDYGWFKNLWEYKRTTPPEYDLNNVRTPIAVYYSKNDWLAAIEDVERLIPMLPNVIKSYLVPHDKFNHLDFLWGTQAPQLLYKEIIETMKSSYDET